MLENVNLDRKISKEEYERLLPSLQRRLYDLEKACWDNKVASMVVFEGWEAAGKGSAISALTQRMDPRGFKVVATELPRTSEQLRPWLHRFWLRTPNRGEMVIFDHSWYDRVLIKRIEEIIPERLWRAAYADIAGFERMLADDGVALVKLFFHISHKEQKKRFKDMADDPLEAWRLDRKSRRQHDRYYKWVEAIEEMLEKTESEYAPWTIVEATNGRWARKKTFDTIIEALERRLGSLAPPREEQVTDAGDAEVREAMQSLEKGEDDDNGPAGGHGRA